MTIQPQDRLPIIKSLQKVMVSVNSKQIILYIKNTLSTENIERKKTSKHAKSH